MTRAGVLVWVTVPPGMSPEQVCREVRACISFGQPETRCLYLEEDPPDDEAGGGAAGQAGVPVG